MPFGEESSLREQSDGAVPHALPVDVAGQRQGNDVQVLAGQLGIAGAHPADVGVVVVEVQPRASRRMECRRTDVDDAI